MVTVCNICWEHKRILYKVCHLCNSGRTCKKCIKTTVLHNRNKLICIMCRQPVKVPRKLLIKYRLNLFDRIKLCAYRCFVELFFKLIMLYYYVITLFSSTLLEIYWTTLVFSQSVNVILLKYLINYSIYDKTFLVSNTLTIITFTLYCIMFINRFNTSSIKLVLITTSIGVTVLTPHLLTNTMILLIRNRYNSVYMLATITLMSLVILVIYLSYRSINFLVSRWVSTGYQHQLDRFINSSRIE